MIRKRERLRGRRRPRGFLQRRRAAPVLAILGRKVQFCHPVGSIDLVDRILAEFRAGQRDVAEFWIELGDKFVHIRFFAVRDEQKRYLGALECVQDIAPLRRLAGNRRLLDEDPAYVTSTTYRHREAPQG